MSSSDLCGKLSIEVEVKSSARSFYEACAKNIKEVPKFCPSYIPKVELVEGKWAEVGSVLNWHLLYEGKEVISQEIYDKVDDEKMSVTYKVIGGLMAQAYKSFKIIFQAIPKKEGSVALWTLDYEKLNADVPDPKGMLQFSDELTQEIDANLIILSQKK